MNRTAALALVSKIEATWSDGRTWSAGRVDAWVEALEQLDEGTAGTAFARLRSTHTDPPSVALFIQTVRSLHTEDASTREKCGWCDGTGWTETARHTAHGQPYTGCEPCAHCPEGRARSASETWTKSAQRAFISDADATRLADAERQRHKPRKPVGAPL